MPVGMEASLDEGDNIILVLSWAKRHGNKVQATDSGQNLLCSARGSLSIFDIDEFCIWLISFIKEAILKGYLNVLY